MKTILQQFRELDLKQFSDARVNVLFNPANLKMLLLSDLAAALTREASAGCEADEIGQQHGLCEAEIQNFFGQIVKEAGIPFALSRQAVSVSEQRVLPKLVLMVNNYCNLKCTYCYEHATVFNKKAINMPHAVLRAALDRFFDAFSAISQIMFIGGEPTLSENVVESACDYAITLASRRGIPAPSFSMISNGVRLTEHMYEVIERHGIQITFSIDGPPAVHDLVRIRHDGSGSYDEVAGNIKRYKALFPHKLGIECTITRAHQKAGLTVSDLSHFLATEFGVEAPHIAVAGLPENDPLNPFSGDDNSLQQEMIEASSPAARGFFDEMCASPEDKYAPRPSMDVVVGMLNTLMRREPILDMCPAGTSQLVVDSFGDMYPCWMFAGMDQFKMGNVLRNDVFNDLGAKVERRIRSNTKAANEQCSTCYARNVCHACLGNNQNSTGALEDAEEHFCNNIRSTLQAVLVEIGVAKQEPGKWAQIRATAAQMKTIKAASSVC